MTGCNYSKFVDEDLSLIYAFAEMAERQTSRTPRFIVYDVTTGFVEYTIPISVAQARTAYNSQHEQVPSGKNDTIWLLNSSKSHALVQIRPACLTSKTHRNSAVQLCGCGLPVVPLLCSYGLLGSNEKYAIL